MTIRWREDVLVLFTTRTPRPLRRASRERRPDHTMAKTKARHDKKKQEHLLALWRGVCMRQGILPIRALSCVTDIP